MKIIKNNKEYDGEKMLRAELKKYTIMMTAALICMTASFVTVFFGYTHFGERGCTMITLMLISYHRLLYIYTSPNKDKNGKIIRMLIYYVFFLTSCMLYVDATKDSKLSFYILNIYAGTPLVVLSLSYYIEERAKKKAILLKKVIEELRRQQKNEESGNQCQ